MGFIRMALQVAGNFVKNTFKKAVTRAVYKPKHMAGRMSGAVNTINPLSNAKTAADIILNPAKNNPAAKLSKAAAKAVTGRSEGTSGTSQPDFVRSGNTMVSQEKNEDSGLTTATIKNAEGKEYAFKYRETEGNPLSPAGTINEDKIQAAMGVNGNEHIGTDKSLFFELNEEEREELIRRYRLGIYQRYRDTDNVRVPAKLSYLDFNLL